jgi:surface antigen
MNKYISFLAALSILTLSSCTGMGVQEGKKGQVGGVGGAAAGAIIGQAIGHDTEATLLGAAIGGLLGYIVGNEMDKYDLRELNHVYERGASNRPSSWVNPDTGNQYSVTPQPAYSNPSTHQPCRKAEIDAIIDGQHKKTYSTACRDEYGRWQLRP